MAQKKAAGSTKNGRDSIGKRLGLKKTNNQYVKIGNILVRQRGTKIKIGKYIGCGKDYTLYALKNGKVYFTKKKKKTIINILPI